MRKWNLFQKVKFLISSNSAGWQNLSNSIIIIPSYFFRFWRRVLTGKRRHKIDRRISFLFNDLNKSWIFKENVVSHGIWKKWWKEPQSVQTLLSEARLILNFPSFWYYFDNLGQLEKCSTFWTNWGFFNSSSAFHFVPYNYHSMPFCFYVCF